jgi:hypothetical protein
MTTSSLAQDNLPARLFLFLSRWSLVTALLILAYFAFYSAAGSAATDNPLGREYAGLWQAVRSPVVYRLAWVSESLSWLMVGGTLIVLAGFFAHRAPIRAACIAVCGIGQLLGSLGAFSLSSVSDLATRYATAAPNQQAALLQSFLDLQAVIHSPFSVGSLLQGAGFLLVAWVAWGWMGFPRWLAVWLAIPGLLGLAFFILGATDAPSALVIPILILHDIGLMSMHVAVAVTFWRPSVSLAWLP